MEGIMSRETRIMECGSWDSQTVISHYESFGWEVLSINEGNVVMSRETQNAVYPELVKLQAAYEAKKNEYDSMRLTATTPEEVPPIKLSYCLIGFVACVFPFVLYMVYKYKQKEKYNELLEQYNAEVAAFNKKREGVWQEMEDILRKGHDTFFARQ